MKIQLINMKQGDSFKLNDRGTKMTCLSASEFFPQSLCETGFSLRQKSTIFTSNREINEWQGIFPDPIFLTM